MRSGLQYQSRMQFGTRGQIRTTPGQEPGATAADNRQHSLYCANRDTPTGPLAGISAIRPLFENLIAEFAKPGASFQMKHQAIAGDYAYILWDAETADNIYEFATDTFVVRDGKIVGQSFAATITPKRR